MRRATPLVPPARPPPGPPCWLRPDPPPPPSLKRIRLIAQTVATLSHIRRHPPPPYPPLPGTAPPPFKPPLPKDSPCGSGVLHGAYIRDGAARRARFRYMQSTLRWSRRDYMHSGLESKASSPRNLRHRRGLQGPRTLPLHNNELYGNARRFYDARPVGIRRNPLRPASGFYGCRTVRTRQRQEGPGYGLTDAEARWLKSPDRSCGKTGGSTTIW